MNFVLPPEVTVKKHKLEGHWAYTFRHDTLGELGRIMLQDLPDGQCHVASEVAGDLADPMTETRLNILRPISEQITETLESVLGSGRQEEVLTPAPVGPKAPTEVVESKLMPCDRCGDTAAMLIFAYDATTTGDFEDYARKMYPKYSGLNVPTWIIGEPMGIAGFDTPSRVLKVWPHRESIQQMTPKTFNAELDELLANHCR